MNNITFAQDIVAVLSDDTEVSNVIGYIENNKRYYKTSDNIVLTGDKNFDMRLLVISYHCHL